MALACTSPMAPPGTPVRPSRNFMNIYGVGMYLYRCVAGVEPNNLPQSKMEYLYRLWRYQPSSKILPRYYLSLLFTKASEILRFDATGTYLILV